MLWEKTYDYGINDKGEHIEKTSDGGFVLIGTSESDDADHEGLAIRVIKVDKDGNVLWDRDYYFNSENYNRGISVKEVNSNEYIILGYSGISTVLFKFSMK